jgi:hypothetical protein
VTQGENTKQFTEKKTKHTEKDCRKKIDQVGLQEAPQL